MKERERKGRLESERVEGKRRLESKRVEGKEAKKKKIAKKSGVALHRKALKGRGGHWTIGSIYRTRLA